MSAERLGGLWSFGQTSKSSVFCSLSLEVSKIAISWSTCAALSAFWKSGEWGTLILVVSDLFLNSLSNLRPKQQLDFHLPKALLYWYPGLHKGWRKESPHFWITTSRLFHMLASAAIKYLHQVRWLLCSSHWKWKEAGNIKHTSFYISFTI